MTKVNASEIGFHGPTAPDDDRPTLRAFFASVVRKIALVWGVCLHNLASVASAYGLDGAVEREGGDKWAWIFEAGWKGLCPRCGKGQMFKSWLKISDRCEVCNLDYRFASPDDGPAFFSLTFVAFPLLFLVVWLQVAYELPIPVLLAIAVPLMSVGCLLPLRPIKGWLVVSQFVHRSLEAGTEKLWADMHAREDVVRRDETKS